MKLPEIDAKTARNHLVLALVVGVSTSAIVMDVLSSTPFTYLFSVSFRPF